MTASVLVLLLGLGALATLQVQGQSTCSIDSLGFDVLDRKVLDTADHWTFVSRAEFSADGEVRSFEIYSGAANRALRVGIYRASGVDCQFELIQQKEFTSFPVGVNKVDLSGSDVFKVQKGDRYGFSWLNYGVIDFDYGSADNYCEDKKLFNVGDTASLVSNRVYGKRDYSIRLQFAQNTEPIGFDVLDRKVLDLADHWTFVSRAEFSADGEVRSFEIYSGAANRALRVGIYRPSGVDCQFELIQQKEFTSFPVGVNKVDLSGSDIFKVQKGDRYGFSWLNYGVIDFDYGSADNYCEDKKLFNVGDTASLVSNRVYGKRDYSIRLQFAACG